MSKTVNRVRHLGTMAAVNPLLKFNSGSRMHMVTSQISQAVVPAHPELPPILTGMEDQLTQYTFGAKAPDNLTVIAVIEKYGSGLSGGSFAHNPMTTVIYYSATTGEFGCFHVEMYQNQLERVHETFGFKYNFTEALINLSPGDTLYKGQPLSVPPTHHDGMYSISLSPNVAYISTPATTEDGFEVSEAFLEKAAPIATASRVGEWGRNCYPVNLYGDVNTYKPFPEIGDRIRDDGLVFALREYDPLLGGIEMTTEELLRPDYVHDRAVYGQPGALVYDVTVNTTTNEGKRTAHTPSGMEALAKKYADASSQYYERIARAYRRIMAEYGTPNSRPVLTGELQTLVAYALGDKPNTNVRSRESSRPRKNSIQKTFRAVPLDEWRVEVFYEYRFKVGRGAKITDMHGG